MAIFQKTIKTLKRALTSPKFLPVVILLFVLSSVVFAASINYKVPSDEYYHFRFTEFYANRSTDFSPFIQEQGLDFFDLADVQRVPDYLYHYQMSFILRILRIFLHTWFSQVFILRLINIGISVGSLWLIYKILKELGAKVIEINLVIMLMCGTGMFLWVASAAGYDPASMTLFLAVLLFGLRLHRGEISAKHTLSYVLLAMATILTKITFAPILLIITIVLLVRLNKKIIQKGAWKDYDFKKPGYILLTCALLLMGGLLVERIGKNVYKYHQINVSCDKVHTYDQCMKDDIFSRNQNQAKKYAAEKAAGYQKIYKPISFTKDWIKDMYERLYFYFGHQQMLANPGAQRTALVTVAILGVILLFSGRALVSSKQELFIVGVVISYTAILYLFNVNTFLTLGERYAFQGRYLLPILPFVYYFVIKAVARLYKKLPKAAQVGYVGLLLALFIINVYMHLPILVFYRGTESKWYSDVGREPSLQIQRVLKKVGIKSVI